MFKQELVSLTFHQGDDSRGEVRVQNCAGF